MSRKKRLAINTGGGDAPGLNAVIRSVVLSAVNRGWEVFGIRRGYEGPFEEDGVLPMDHRSVSGITHLGGTVLGTTNRGNPLEYPVTLEDGTTTTVDRTLEILEQFDRRKLDALIAIGGDGSLRIASHLSEHGLPVIGVPKTIDNDLAATEVTFGFHTAVQTASDAIDKLHSTAESHRRVMVVEVMGRDTGWIALFAGVSGTADVILIPEIPFAMESVCQKIEQRYTDGPQFAVVVVAEGAKALGGEAVFQEAESAGGAARYGGIGEQVAGAISKQTGRETREITLGYLQRGGQPTAYDRLLALRFGAAAVGLAEAEDFGCMVALRPPAILGVPLREGVERIKTVPLDGDVVRTARGLGISFGDTIEANA